MQIKINAVRSEDVWSGLVQYLVLSRLEEPEATCNRVLPFKEGVIQLNGIDFFGKCPSAVVTCIRRFGTLEPRR